MIVAAADKKGQAKLLCERADSQPQKSTRCRENMVTVCCVVHLKNLKWKNELSDLTSFHALFICEDILFVKSPHGVQYIPFLY